MRKLFVLSTVMLLTVSLFFTSCTDDTDPVDLPPGISFVTGSSYISGDATLEVNTPFMVKVLAEANATSNARIETMKITRVFDLQSWDTTLTVNQTTFSLEANFISAAQAGVERITFEITDKDGQKASIKMDITTEVAVNPIAYRTFTMKILGSYQSATGSSFASIDGNVYTMAQAFANQAAIDFLYWWGATTSATIGAPDDDNANAVYTGPNGLPNWTTKNATRFKNTALTAAEFDAITDGAPLITNATGADQTRIGSLAVGNVFAFKTVSNKDGLIKVVAINTGAAGDITIDVKVVE